MNWEKKDLVHVLNLIRILNEKATFKDMSVRDNVELNAAFQWTDNLKNKINESLTPVEAPNTDKPQIEAKKNEPIKTDEVKKKGWFK